VTRWNLASVVMAECHLKTRQLWIVDFVYVGGGLHLRSLLWRYVGNRWVFEDAAVEELHDVEVAANDRFILTQREGLRYGYISVFEGVEDAVFAVDLVCCLDVYC
jgi:hypothetical protein